MNKSEIIKKATAFFAVALLFAVRISFFEEPTYLSAVYLIVGYFFIEWIPTRYVSLISVCGAGIALEIFKNNTVIWILPIAVIFWLLKNNGKSKIDSCIAFILLAIWFIRVASLKKGFVKYQFTYAPRFFLTYNSITVMLTVFSAILLIVIIATVIYSILQQKKNGQDGVISCIRTTSLFNLIYIFIILLYQGFSFLFPYYQIILLALIISRLPFDKVKEQLKEAVNK